MNQPTPLIAQLEQQLLLLASKASQIDQQAPSWQQRDWFDSSLFQCHSPMLLDYVQESMGLLKRLTQIPTSSRESSLAAVFQHNRQALAEKLSAQLTALTRAFANLENRANEQSYRQYRNRQKNNRQQSNHYNSKRQVGYSPNSAEPAKRCIRN